MEWISVKDNLPNDDTWVLLYNGYSIIIGQLNDRSDEHEPRWHDQTVEDIYPEPAHWQTLPEPPK